MFVLSFGRKADDEMKTIKREFWEDLESINCTLAEQSGGHAGGKTPSGLLATTPPHSESPPPPLQHVRNLCPPPATGGAD